MVKSLKSTGKGVVVLPHGVLFRGNAEATIRTELIKRGYIKAIIGLPANLFYGTGIPACLIVLDKKDAQARTGIFMIDASKGFEKDGPKNRLRPRDMHKIVDAFVNQKEIDRYSRMVPLSEIARSARTTTTSTSRATSTARSPRTSRTCTPTCRAASRTATSTRCSRTGTRSRACAPSCSSRFARATPSWPSTRPTSRRTVTGSAEYQAFAEGTSATVDAWWAEQAQAARGHHARRPGRTT